MQVLDRLNPQQRAAVTAADGPILILAGAGSGKTRVIVARIAFLIAERGVAPDSILAVTFTNKAADEMRRRVRGALGEARDAIVGDPAVFTFHALCLRAMRRFGTDIGLASGFTLYAEDDRRSQLRRLCREANLSDREFPVARVAAFVSRFKQRRFNRDPERDDYFSTTARTGAERYQKLLEAQQAVDFDDLLIRGIELFECSERAQSFAARRFQHLLVDEYQDTNRVQYRLIRLLAPHGRIFVVGDEDQSIYNFRGADLRNILDFERDFPGAAVFKLEENYRSTNAILKAANAVIGCNQERKGKRLVSSRGEGTAPRLHRCEDEQDEARYIARMAMLRRAEHQDGTLAVLVRTHAQTRPIEEELVARGIPHRIIGGQRFYDRKEIRDTLAYLKLALNPSDDASFRRVVNVPARGVGAATMESIESRAAESSLWQASGEILEDGALPARPHAGLVQFRSLVEELRSLAERLAPSELLLKLLERSGLERELARDGAAQAEQRRENLGQLTAAAQEYESSEPQATAAGFLDRVGLLTDLDNVSGPTPCLLMTLHAAKGLEFDTVFLGGLEEGLFPHIRSIGDPRAIEEERRLFYVGMTRAKQRLYLTFAARRRFAYQEASRQASRFLEEIPPELLEGAGLATYAPAVGRDGRSGLAPPHQRKRGGGGIRRGAVVRHQKFGEGRVLEASGVGHDQKITVLFNKAGRKRLVAGYAKLEIVG